MEEGEEGNYVDRKYRREGKRKYIGRYIPGQGPSEFPPPPPHPRSLYCRKTLYTDHTYQYLTISTIQSLPDRALAK